MDDAPTLSPVAANPPRLSLLPAPAALPSPPTPPPLPTPAAPPTMATTPAPPVITVFTRPPAITTTAQPSDGRWWLGAGVMLNAMLVGLTLVSALSTREELVGMRSRAGDHATAAASQALEMKAIEKALLDVRRAVSAHAREEGLFLKIMILKPSIDYALARRIAAAVQASCQLHGQDPNLVLSIIAVQSGFNPTAVSAVGAEGLMQVMPQWKTTLGPQELTDPEASIRAGVQVLAYYQQLYRDEELMVIAYNRGPGPQELSPANRAYPEKVIALWQRLKDIDVAGRP